MPFRAEYAFQTENQASVTGIDFFLNYWHMKLGLDYNGYEAGFGFESHGGLSPTNPFGNDTTKVWVQLDFKL